MKPVCLSKSLNNSPEFLPYFFFLSKLSKYELQLSLPNEHNLEIEGFLDKIALVDRDK